MTKSKNSTVKWGRFFWNSVLLLSTGASAALILRELREHTRTLEGLAEQQHLLRDQVRILLSSAERLSSAVDALSASTGRESQTTKAALPDKNGATKSGATKSNLAKAGATKITSTKATAAKPVRAKKNRESGSESDTGAKSQETLGTGDFV